MFLTPRVKEKLCYTILMDICLFVWLCQQPFVAKYDKTARDEPLYVLESL